ncbi:MAG TPA: glutathione S-transferase family protein [Nevskiaceae bacterium]|nr:glutathione S-transferase family protein [Nevskiaceae bacterium]
MKLYDWSIAPNPRRVRMYLAEKGVQVETVQVAGPRDMQLAQWFLDMSPRRRVPLLELDDGTQIGEAMAICRYFEATHPASPLLFGRDPREAAVIDMWEREADNNCLQAGGESMRNTHPAFAGRALPGYAEPTPQIPELGKRGRMRYYAFQAQADARLSNNRFLGGEIFSVADITPFCGLAFWGRFRLPLADEHVHLKRWFAEIEARPSASA